MAKNLSRRSRNQRKNKTRTQKKSSRRNRNRNRNHNHNQRGGMAEWSAAGDYTLIGPDARVSAQVGPLDSAFGELPSVIPQRGGRRNRNRSRSRSRSFKKSRTQSRKRNHSRRNQKGGMAPFGDAGRTLTAAQYAADGTNPQFRTEVDVNERYTGFSM